MFANLTIKAKTAGIEKRDISCTLVHGLATMINEGTIEPGIYGAQSAREIITALLGSPQAGKKVNSQVVAKKTGK